MTGVTEVQHSRPADVEDDLADELSDEAVARLLGVAVGDLVPVLGGRWRRASKPSEPEEEWYVTGEPAQVALGSVGPALSMVVLARPVVRWAGHQPEWTFEDPHPVDPQDLHRDPGAVRRVADDIAARRRSFRWCPTCRDLTAPEHMSSGGYCMGCAAAYHGVVF